ncbi:hypothetical protein NQZ68_005680 [Dissostichus eleginoides]|nr:hypothetical protein NQZ68_005680 [Dissostichus eleginoides]
MNGWLSLPPPGSCSAVHLLSSTRPVASSPWQREEEAARDEGGSRCPTCPPHRRHISLRFPLPSFPHTAD